MSSKVLDLTTIAHALNELERVFLGDTMWGAYNDEQDVFLHWYAERRDEINQLDSLEALASTDHEVLNEFLKVRKFSPMFEPIPAGGCGVASVLDMLVEWVEQGKITTISRQNDSYPAFKIARDGVDVFDVEGYDEPLVCLHTKTGHNLWLMKADEPASGLELNRLVQQVLTGSERRPCWDWKGVVVPKLEMSTGADLSWLIGMNAVSTKFLNDFRISAAFQQFKLRANEKGARVKVATGITIEAVSMPRPPYEFDDPFVGFFTQPGHEDLPLAVFWADTDSWKEPEGTLEEL